MYPYHDSPSKYVDLRERGDFPIHSQVWSDCFTQSARIVSTYKSYANRVAALHGVQDIAAFGYLVPRVCNAIWAPVTIPPDSASARPVLAESPVWR